MTELIIASIIIIPMSVLAAFIVVYAIEEYPYARLWRRVRVAWGCLWRKFRDRQPRWVLLESIRLAELTIGQMRSDMQLLEHKNNWLHETNARLHKRYHEHEAALQQVCDHQKTIVELDMTTRTMAKMLQTYSELADLRNAEIRRLKMRLKKKPKRRPG